MTNITPKIFTDALNRVASTDDGKIVLAALKEICQWDETYLSSSEPLQTQFFAVKRGVYGGLRKLIKGEHLKEIEFNFKYITRSSDVGTNPNSRSKSRTKSRTKSSTRDRSGQ